MGNDDRGNSRPAQAAAPLPAVVSLSRPPLPWVLALCALAHAEDDDTYRIDVSVRNDQIDDDARSAVGTLLIISNDRTESRKEVPLFGSGRINKVAAPGSGGAPP